MAEWTKAPVLKTGEAQASVGSNPTPSASASKPRPCYAYVLLSRKNGRLYIGSSEEPDRRIDSHNGGKVRSTKHHRPWECIFVEEHPNRSTAERRERYLKSDWGRRWLKNHLAHSGLAT